MKNFLQTQFLAIPENERLARQIVASFVIDLNPTVEEICDIKTSVSEAVTTSIVHGYKGQEGIIYMQLECEGMEISVEIQDLGAGIENIEKARQPLYTTEPEMERSGMGFTVMESFMDYLDVISEKGNGTKIINQLPAPGEKIIQDGYVTLYTN